jgi:hypothetical protein
MNRFLTVLACAVTASSLYVGVGYLSLGDAAGSPRGGSDPVPAATDVPQSHLLQHVDGSPWSLVDFLNSSGQICIGLDVPNDAGDGGRGVRCSNVDDVFGHGPIYHFAGSRQVPGKAGWATEWIGGVVSSDVARLELRLMDCSAEPLKLDAQRFFFRVFGGSQIASDTTPRELLAYDSFGKVISREPTAIASPDASALPDLPPCA